MIEAEGHVFVSRPIVKAKETAGAREGNHCVHNTLTLTARRTDTHTLIRRPIVTPIRLSDKDDALASSTGGLRLTHTQAQTHTAGG